MVTPNSACLLSSGQVGFSDCQLSITGVFYYHGSSEKRLESKYRAVLEKFYASYISLLETALDFILSLPFLSHSLFLCRFSFSYCLLLSAGLFCGK